MALSYCNQYACNDDYKKARLRVRDCARVLNLDEKYVVLLLSFVNKSVDIAGVLSRYNMTIIIIIIIIDNDNNN